MTLDLFASVLCGFVAFCLFTLHIVSGPGRRHFLTLPEYLRRGVLASGVLFMVRAVNFTMLESNELGRINAIGVMALLLLAYTIGAVTWFLVSNHLPADMWDRLLYVKRQEKEHPELVPVMMTKEAVVDAARSQGWKVTPPGAPAAALHETSAKPH